MELYYIYRKEEYKVEGQFYIPNFSKIGYKRVINPETFIAETISFYNHKRPIRQDKWLYDNKGIIVTEEYNIIIDDSRVRN
jgi:hypothetical protein